VTAKVARIPHIRIYEVAVSYRGRTYAEGKKINWKDGLAALAHIARFNLLPGRVRTLPDGRREAFVSDPDRVPRLRTMPPPPLVDAAGDAPDQSAGSAHLRDTLG
jgi:hypothetical protein